MHADLERRLRETRPDLTPPEGTRERLAGRLGIQESRARGPYAWLGGRRRGVALLAGAVLVAGTAVGTAVVALRSGGNDAVRVLDQPEGSWTRAEPLSVRFLNEYPEPVVAVDDRGRAVVAWERAGRIEIRTRTATGGWEPVRVASTAERATDPVVAVAPDGRGQVVWRERRGGRWEVLPLVGPDGVRFGQLRRKAGVRYVIAARGIDLDGGALGPVRTVSQPTPRQGDMQQMSAGADASGRVSVAWARLGALEVATTDARGRWGAPVRMRATNGGTPWRLNLSVEREGHRAVIWHAVGRRAGAGNAVMVVTGTGAGWSSPAELDRPDTYTGDTPVVTIDRRGRTWAVWTTPSQGDQVLVWAALDDGAWAAWQPLTGAADGTVGAAGVATSGDGTAVVVWGQTPDLSLGGPRGTTRAAVLPLTGPARDARTLSRGTVVLQSRQGTPITADGSGRVIAMPPDRLGITAFTWRAGRTDPGRAPVTGTAAFWLGRSRIAAGRDGTLVGVATRGTPGGDQIVAYTRSPETP